MKNFDFYKEFEQMIRQTGVDSVVILGHMNPDGDAVGSVFGMAHALKSAYPDLAFYPYMPTITEKGALLFLEKENTFDRFTLPDQPYIVICCDTAIKKRIITPEIFDGAEASIGIDHHRSNENYCDVNYVKVTEACAELIFWMLMEKEDVNLLEQSSPEAPRAADYLYLGILHDTAVFTRAQVSTLRGAATLLEMGVDHREMMRTWETKTMEDLRKQNAMIAEAKTIAGGKIAYLMKTHSQVVEENISYDEIHPISGYLRDCADVICAFTLYEQTPGYWRCSLRADGTIVDANQVLGHFGGGGHKGAAGMRFQMENGEKIKEELLEILEALVTI